MPLRARDMSPAALRELIAHCNAVAFDTPIAQVEATLEHSHATFAAVLKGRRPFGLCSRELVASILSHQYGRALFARRPIGEFVGANAVVVADTDPITSTLQRANDRPAEHFHDDIVLVDAAGDFLGLIPAARLLRLQHRFFEQAIVDLRNKQEELAAQMRRVDYELSLAGRVQDALLPSTAAMSLQLTLTGSRRRCLQIRPYYRRAAQLGGDYYRLVKLDEHRLGILLCDVMGHGVASALIVSLLGALSESALDCADRPGDFLTRLNERLCASIGENEPMFVTALYLLFDLETGVLEIANAGHPAPLNLATAVQHLDVVGGLPLGMLPGQQYAAERMELCNGQRVLAFTDGLFEVRQPGGRMLGLNALETEARKLGSCQREQFMPQLLDRVASILPGAKFDDDVCSIVIDYHEAPDIQFATGDTEEFSVSLAGVTAARQHVHSRLEALGLSPSRVMAHALAVSELGANLVEHGRVEGPTFRLGVRATVMPQVVLSAAHASFANEAALRASAADLDTLDPMSESGRGLGLVLHWFPTLRYVPREALGDGLEHFILGPCAAA